MPDRQPLGEINQNTLPTTTTPPLRKKIGKKPMPIAKRQYTLKNPIQRVERSYRQPKKAAVLLYLEHHRYPLDPTKPQRQRAGDTPLDPANSLYHPTFHEATTYFKIPFLTVVSWY
ncbi:hypothetical protein LY78DRAFT_658798 [Colletotrichum sublineola]|nr:hypothetical protein LY78DRAFT_658798 [Colletotrichum sublineola]